MGSLYVVSGRSFYRAFTISSTEDSVSESQYHAIDNVRNFLDKVWPFSINQSEDTQNQSPSSDGRIGDMAAVIVVYENQEFKRKLYKRNFGVSNTYTWTEEVEG